MPIDHRVRARKWLATRTTDLFSAAICGPDVHGTTALERCAAILERLDYPPPSPAVLDELRRAIAGNRKKGSDR